MPPKPREAKAATNTPASHPATNHAAMPPPTTVATDHTTMALRVATGCAFLPPDSIPRTLTDHPLRGSFRNTGPRDSCYGSAVAESASTSTRLALGKSRSASTALPICPLDQRCFSPQ
jgi:hypothetical protein